MGDGTQVLEGVAFLGDGVGVGFDDPAGDADPIGLDLPALTPPLGGDHDAADLDGATRREGDDLVIILKVLVRDYLHGVKARTVVHLDEGETAPRRAPGPYPASDGNGVAEGDIFVNNG